jgi:uncharacterized protein (DUF924 family)
MIRDEPERVLAFWFPDLSGADHARMVRQFEWWFRGGANAAVAERFAALFERAARGELDHWSAHPRSRLALILVLDQFSRALYKDSAQAYAQDPKALALALEGIRIGHHRDVIARFGRQPHRNALLGRQSTPEELEYLARGELVHKRAVPS